MFTNLYFYVVLAASSMMAGDMYYKTLARAPKDSMVYERFISQGTCDWKNVDNIASNWINCSSNIVPSTRVFFSPNYGGDDCLSNIVTEINSATNYIYMQAYVFTSQGILDSLVNAHKRGVNVDVLIDKGCTNYMRYITGLTTNSIPVKIDYKHAIAHNKIMIIDDYIVITGSYNFTKAAENNNAENLVIFHNVDIAKKYKNNFIIHKDHSTVLGEVRERKQK